jgi:hypothetical protein
MRPRYQKTARRYLFALLLATPSFGASETALAQTETRISDYIVELDELVEERTLGSFANEWWKWAFSMQQTQSPVRDRDGTYCDVNQSGSVWFLAGGFGTSKISRKCTLPAEQHLFFPVINMVRFPPPGSNLTCEDAKRGAARNNNDFTYIRVVLNDTQLENAERFRIAPDECFNIYERVPQEYAAPSGSPSATDGYWIMLRPLPPGTHTLEFKAFYTNPTSKYGDMVQNISYELTVPALE